MNEQTPMRTFTGWVSELAREHTASLAVLARNEGLTQEDALDAVQEAFDTFLRLPQARSLVGEPAETRALMSVIVRNAARNMRRRHHRKKPHQPVEDTPLADHAPSVDELLGDAEDHVLLQGCVDKLSEVQRRVVRLRMLEEMSGAEAGRELDMTPGHVAVLLHRAKQDLLRCMAK